MTDFNLQTLRQAVTESGLAPSNRSLRISINDYVDAHPLLRADLVEIHHNRNNYRRVYDQQRHMETVIREYDRKNGNVLASMQIEPSRLIEYVRDRVNRHAEHAGFRLTRGRVAPLQLTAPESEDTASE